MIDFTPPKSLKYSLFAPRPDLADTPENYLFMTYLLEEYQGITRLSIIQDDPRPQTQPTEEDEGGNTILLGLKRLVENG